MRIYLGARAEGCTVSKRYQAPFSTLGRYFFYVALTFEITSILKLRDVSLFILIKSNKPVGLVVCLISSILIVTFLQTQT